MSPTESYWKQLPARGEGNAEYHVVIEIPRGQKVKYEYNKSMDVLFLDRVLYSAVHYPENYGFIPRTLTEDGDPIDVLLMCQQPLYPMTVAEARPLGGLRMEDEKGVDDKILAVALRDPHYQDHHHYRDLPDHKLLEIRQFFADYKQLEQKFVSVEDLYGPDRARDLIEESLDRFQNRDHTAERTPEG